MRGLRRRVVEMVARTLIHPARPDPPQTDRQLRRRRAVVGAVALVGAVLLGISLRVRPGDASFYPLTLAIALTWFAGGLLAGPLHLGYLPVRGTLRRPVLAGLAVGALAGGVFLAGGLLVRLVPPLHRAVESVLAHAEYGSLPLIVLVTLVNGIAEEVFFRGGLYAAAGRRHAVLISTVVYGAATLAAGNPMLVFAALTLGTVLGLQRRASGGILAPIITHCTWQMMMLFLLPPILG